MHTTTTKLEYSYHDADGYHFMDLETYEDTILGDDIIGEGKRFLVEGNPYDIFFIEEQAVKLELPAAVEATVIDAPEGIRGDTASNVQKPVTIASGLVVQVPLFIKKNETIRVSTADGSYLGRA